MLVSSSDSQNVVGALTVVLMGESIGATIFSVEFASFCAIHARITCMMSWWCSLKSMRSFVGISKSVTRPTATAFP